MRSDWIDGSATFTTVLSSMIMNRAKHMEPSVHHLRFCSVIARRRVIGVPPLRAVARDLGTRQDLVERVAELAPLGDGEAVQHLLEGLDARRDQPLHQAVALLGGAHALHAAVDRVLGALDDAALDERLDRAARGGEGDAEPVRDVLDRQLAGSCATSISALNCVNVSSRSETSRRKSESPVDQAKRKKPSS